MGKTLFLLDGHSLTHRAFYALPLLTNEEGEYTNAVYGFTRMLFKLLDEENPDFITVAFDKKAPTFRHLKYPEYKAKRKKMPEELRPQFSLIKEVLKALKIPIFELDKYEADDVLGTLAKKGEAEGLEVVIVTGDRDALQLVNENIRVMYTKKGISDIVNYNLEKVRKEYQLEPEQLIDMKGLMGDNSDNIPGVPGIGEKISIKLLKEFSSLENVLNNIDKVSGKKRKENLNNNIEQAKLSKNLAKIVCDVPIDINLRDCMRKEAKKEKIVDLFNRLGFTSLIDRFQKRETIQVSDFKLIEIENEKQLEKLLSKIEGKGLMVFTFLLTEKKNLFSNNQDKLVIALNKDKIYVVELNEDNMSLLKPYFENTNIAKYILNAKEVMLKLRNYDIKLANLQFEPLLASYLLHPSDNLPSLEELLKEELNLLLPEDISPVKSLALILSKLFSLYDILIAKLEKKELLKLYQEVELPLIKVLVAMEYNGIKVSKDDLKSLSLQFEDSLAVITEKVYQLTGEEFNINSPKQLGEVLFNKLKLPVIKKTKTGYSTSSKVLEELLTKHEVIPLIIEYRQLMKLKSTYVDALASLINPKTGRLHTSFNQMVTATGRLSSTDPNLQNIPIRTKEGREIRKAFIPQNQEWILLAADYSQIELRVLAHISQDKNLEDAFNNQQDIHTQTASEVFEVEPADVTADLRRHAKVINFGIAYGMSSYGLAQDLNISKKEAKDYIDKYFQRFAGVKEYMDKIKQEAKLKGFVTTIFKRIRYIPDINSRNFHLRSFAQRAAINTPIQGSAADIMKIAMNNVYNRLKKEKYQAKILLQVHDELVLEVFKEDLKVVAQILKEEMEQAVDLNVPLVIDLQIADNWRDKQDYLLD